MISDHISSAVAEACIRVTRLMTERFYCATLCQRVVTQLPKVTTPAYLIDFRPISHLFSQVLLRKCSLKDGEYQAIPFTAIKDVDQFAY